MGRESALWYFESVDLYDVLCPHKLKVMGDKHIFHHFKKDQFIYFPDEPATHIYMIAEGRVRIGHYLDDGKEVINAILSTGEIFVILAPGGLKMDYFFIATGKSFSSSTSVNICS